MTPFFFLIPLCLSLGGVDQDCNYQYEVLPSMDLLQERYQLYMDSTDVGLVKGFYSNAEKTMFVSPLDTVETILHEIEHIKCFNDFPVGRDIELLNMCNFKVDQHLLSQSIRPESDKIGINTIPIPEISDKMAFRNLIFSNQEIPTKNNG